MANNRTSSDMSAGTLEVFASMNQSSGGPVFCTTKGINVFPAVQNITCMTVDALVISINANLPWKKGVAKVIADTAGPKMVKEYQDKILKAGKFEFGDIVVTSAGNLSSKYVIHVALHKMSKNVLDEHYLTNFKNTLKTNFRKCFEEADKYKVSKLALPLLSTG